MTRQEANNELLHILIQKVKDHPHLRLGQILSAYGFVDGVDIPDYHGSSQYWENEFYLESEALLSRVIEKIKSYEDMNGVTNE